MSPLSAEASKAAGHGIASGLGHALSLPPRLLHAYQDFITKNASQVSQIESALRSLTYIIPGRFRDAEIASESIHSGVQLLSLHHDNVLLGALAPSGMPSAHTLSPHNRYTRFWMQKSAIYRRIAYLLQIVCYTELLCEMTAKRRGERTRWRVVVLLEAVKALCRLLLLRITQTRPLVTPALPERQPIPEDEGPPEYDASTAESDVMENGSESKRTAVGWNMPRTGMVMPALPAAGDVTSFLRSRVLTADDIKPAAKLLNRLSGSARAGEVLHILVPFIFAVAMARTRNKRSWTPWIIGLAAEVAARHLGDGKPGSSLRMTALERDEWSRRAWAMAWWTMRGAFYENVTKGLVGGVKRRMPGLLAGILEDYEYLWENYHFSTSM